MSQTVVPLDSMPQYVANAVSGQAGYTTCPACSGGGQRRLTLGLNYVSPHIVYATCFRASCGAKYVLVTDASATFSQKQVKPARPYDQPTRPLRGEPLDSLVRDYGLSPAVMERRGWRLTDNREALVLPIRDRWGLVIGHITRTLSKPKVVRTYKETARPFLDFWPAPSGPTVIVEDCLSACRLQGLDIPAVALLGTNMSTADAKEIAAFARGHAVIALDADAWDKSVRYAEKYAHVLQLTPFPLTLDIKDIGSDDEIRSMLSGWNAHSSSNQTEPQSV